MKLLNLNGPQAVMALMVRRKWWIIVPFVGLSAAVTLLTYMLPKMYVSQSRILIQPRDVPSDFVKDLVAGTTEQRLSVIAQTVLTRDNLKRIVIQFENDLPEYRNWEPDDAAVAFGKQINLKFAADQQIANGQLPITSFQISYQNRNANVARDIAKSVTDLFINQDKTNRAGNVTGTVDFIKTQVNDLYEQLTKSDKELSKLRSKRRGELPSQLDANLQTVASLRNENQNIADRLLLMDDAMRRLEQEIEKTPKEVSKASSPVQSPAAIFQNQKIADYRAKQRDLKELKSRGYTESYPPVRTLVTQVESLEKDMTPEELLVANGKDEKPEVVAAAAPEMVKNGAYEVLVEQKRQLELLIKITKQTQEKNDNTINSTTAHINNTPIGEQELSEVMRVNLDLNRRYQDMKDKLSVAELSQKVETNEKGDQFKLVETPVAPATAAKPAKPVIIGGGMLASLLIGLALAIIVDIGNQKMWTHSDIEALLGATVLVEIPEIVTPDDMLTARKKRTGRLATLGAAAAVYAVFLYFVHLHGTFVLQQLDPLIWRLY